MRVAWFRADPSSPPDGLPTGGAWSACLDRLAQMLTLEIITEAGAHDFVVEQALRPYDLCVFEPRDTPTSDFIWAYLFQYPGLLLIQDLSLHDSRVRTFERHLQRQRYRDEFTFNHGHPPLATGRPFPRGTWPMLRAPILASLASVVPDEERRLALTTGCPEATIYTVPPCAPGPAATVDPASSTDSSLRVASLTGETSSTLARAVERAVAGGAAITLLPATHLGDGLPDADVVVHLGSPSDSDMLTQVLTAMARERPVIVLEGEATAVLPALDPQTWRPRNVSAGEESVVVSLDPRDEEHSLMLALQGLARDRALGITLGRAARRWWMAHGTPEKAADAWRRVIEHAVSVPVHARPQDWPAHLGSDAVPPERAAALELGILVDDRDG